MKVALVQDWLTSYGGAEKCIEALCEVWPEAEVFTLVYRPEVFKDSIISKHKVHTSFVQRLPLSTKFFRHYFALYPFAVEQYDLNEFDVIISFSAAFSHGVITGPEQLHICYKHTPMRYAWSGYHEYMKDPHIRTKWKNWLARFIIHRMRRWDYLAAQRPDFIIVNSQEVKRRVWKFYRREAIVINPPVEVDKITSVERGAKGDYYFTMSRMVPYKKIDLIVKTFSVMPDRTLVVASAGPEMARIRKLAKNCPNIELLGFVEEARKFELLRKARAFIFAAHEDFGIVAVEAQACGTPVIAYGKGGALETMVDGKTGVLFNPQTVEGLKEAVIRFLEMEDSFDAVAIRKHAEKFSVKIFKDKFSQFVEEKWGQLKIHKS